jgi:hypothetical protein
MLKLDVLAAELNLWANETEQIYRATKEIKYRRDTTHLRYLAATLNQSSLPIAGVTQIIAGTNITISPTSGLGAVTINASNISANGLPAGGTTGQILAKIDNTNYNAEWIDNYATWTSQLKHEVKAGQAINKGQAVYVSSADGTNMIVSKASNISEATSSKTMGLLAQNLAINGKGFVITEGLLAGLDTTGANAAGDPVWLGANGDLIYGLLNKPYAPLHLVFIGIVTRRNANNGEIFVKVQNGFELDELHNVDARNPNNNDGIFYNSTTQLWEHKQISAVYSTPTLAQVTTAGNTTTNAITVGGLTVATNLIITDAVNGRINFGDTTTSDSAVSFRFTKNSTTDARLGVYGSNKLGVYLGLVGNNAAIYAYNYTAGAAVPLILNGFGGNVLINTTTDAGYKLDVNGTARVSSIMAGTQASISAGVKIESDTSIRAWSQLQLGQFNSTYLTTSALTYTASGADGYLFRNIATHTATVGTYYAIRLQNNIAPTSGTGIFNLFEIVSTINQTGGANGITRGLYINPTLTSAADFRAIETVVGNVIFGSTSGNVLVGTTTDAGYKLDVNGSVRMSGTTYFGGTNNQIQLNKRGGTTASSYLTLLQDGNNRTFTFYQRASIFGAGVDVGMEVGAGFLTLPYYQALIGAATTTSNAKLIVTGSITAASALAQGVYFNNTLVAAANNDVLVGLDINPTFTNGAFTGVGNYAARITGNVVINAPAFNVTNSLYVGGSGGSRLNNIVIGGGYGSNTITDAAGSATLRLSSTGFGFHGAFNTITAAAWVHIKNAVSGSPILRLDDTSGVQLFTVLNSGNVLIGTTTDAGYKLDVNGTARVQTNLNVGGVINTAATYTNCGLNAPVNVTTNGTVIIGFTAKLDPNGWWNPGTKKWTPTIPGYYYVALQVRWDIGTLGNQINIQILQNTNTVAIAQDLLPTNTGLTQTTNAILYMNGSTDYLEFSGFTSSTSGEFIFGEPAGNWTFFNAFRIN